MPSGADFLERPSHRLGRDQRGLMGALEGGGVSPRYWGTSEKVPWALIALVVQGGRWGRLVTKMVGGPCP